MIVVVGASVALKWFFRERPGEDHVDNALSILPAIESGRAMMVQPPHFLAEMAAVLAREKADGAEADLFDLRELEWHVADGAEIYETALDLAIRLEHHLFDTLYHAVALHTPEATLVTADWRYLNAADGIDRIMPLADFSP